MVVASPSSAVDRALVDRGIARLRARGLDVVEAPGIDRVRGDTAGTDDERAAAVATALGPPPARALWCARGGYGATRLLAHVGLEALAAEDVAVVGFSDATALLWPLADRGGRAVHGPMVETLGQGLDGATEAALEALLFGPGRHEVRYAGRRVAGRGPLEGVVRAGNLSVLAALCGTPWTPRAEGAVVFLEEVNEPTYRLDRALTQILQTGVLDGAAGVVFGDLSGCGPRPPEGPAASVEEVLADFAERSGLPVLAGFPFGHGPSTGVLPLGARVRIDERSAALSLDGPPWGR